MVKDNKPKQQNGSNRGTGSADMANQPGHSAEYHKADNAQQRTKK